MEISQKKATLLEEKGDAGAQVNRRRPRGAHRCHPSIEFTVPLLLLLSLDGKSPT